MAWERDTSLKGLLCALPILSPRFKQRFKSLLRWACCRQHTPSTSSVFPKSMNLFDPSLMAITHPHRYCQHTHKSICRRCVHRDIFCFCSLVFVSADTLLVYTCLTELAAKTKKVKQKRAANVCEYRGICKDITAGRISSRGIRTQTYTHTNTVHTASHRDPVSAAHSMTGGHMQNTYTHTQIIYAHRERNKTSLQLCAAARQGPAPMDWEPEPPILIW